MPDDEKTHQEELDQLRAERDRAVEKLDEVEAFYEEKQKEFKQKIFEHISQLLNKLEVEKLNELFVKRPPYQKCDFTEIEINDSGNSGKF